VPDPIFADPRLAEIYDPLDPDRSDLDAYLAYVDRFAARSVLDVGCGTGTFACLVAARGIDVVGVDLAAASLEVARRKPAADRVRWVLGDATSVPPCQADLAVMTGNVAQVFLGDDEWSEVLTAVHAALRPGGAFVFEMRDPRARAWEAWTRAATFERVDLPGVGPVEQWVDVTEVAGELVSFTWTFRFERTGDELTSVSTLRFRERDGVEASLAAAGFELLEVADAPDRPGREFVFVTRRP
jgi:SAM-dependent methyltransferase